MPSGLPVVKGSKSRSTRSWRGPAPLSSTRIVAACGSELTTMRTQPPDPAASIALSTRFNSNCRSNSASADNSPAPTQSASSCNRTPR